MHGLHGDSNGTQVTNTIPRFTFWHRFHELRKKINNADDLWVIVFPLKDGMQ